MKLKMPKAVFWDWDGTLIDSYAFLNDAHNFTLTSLGFAPFKEGEYKNFFGKPRDILYPAIYKDKCEEAIEIFQKYVLENNHKVKALPDCRPVLELFYQKNIPMGIVSNKKANLIERELKHLKWEQYFKIVVGAGDAEFDKPSGAPLLLAIEKTGKIYDNNHIWYIGDTENDLACAKNARCPSIFLTEDKNSSTLIKKYDPLLKFDTYRQLMDILVAI